MIIKQSLQHMLIIFEFKLECKACSALIAKCSKCETPIKCLECQNSFFLFETLISGKQSIICDACKSKDRFLKDGSYIKF